MNTTKPCTGNDWCNCPRCRNRFVVLTQVTEMQALFNARLSLCEADRGRCHHCEQGGACTLSSDAPVPADLLAQKRRAARLLGKYSATAAEVRRGYAKVCRVNHKVRHCRIRKVTLKPGVAYDAHHLN